MDIEKSGKFIAICRKKRGLTQKELAEKLGVTDKAVSRWETGKGFPDVSLLIPLAEVLDVSVSDILCGEAANSQKDSDDAIAGALSFVKDTYTATAVWILLIAGLAMLISPMFTAGTSALPALVIGTILIAAALLIKQGGIIVKLNEFIRRLPKSIAGICALVTIITALVLEALPYGAVLIFATPDSTFRSTYSYFDLMPFGYANFAPLITALLTCTVMTMAIIVAVNELRRKECTRLKRAAFICSVIAALISILPPIVYGADYLSVTGALITVMLTLSAISQTFFNRK